jgi:transposase
MGKNVYSNEIKWAVVKDKMSGQFTNHEIMERYGIKSVVFLYNIKFLAHTSL